MTQINITDFRNNLKKYSELAKKKDFEVVNRGETVFIVKSPKSVKKEAFNALAGAAKSDIPYEKILENKAKKL